MSLREPLPTGSERILFIDDEQVLVEIGGEMLAPCVRIDVASIEKSKPGVLR